MNIYINSGIYQAFYDSNNFIILQLYEIFDGNEKQRDILMKFIVELMKSYDIL